MYYLLLYVLPVVVCITCCCMLYVLPVVLVVVCIYLLLYVVEALVWLPATHTAPTPGNSRCVTNTARPSTAILRENKHQTLHTVSIL